jgi:hypothetical protein
MRKRLIVRGQQVSGDFQLHHRGLPEAALPGIDPIKFSGSRDDRTLPHNISRGLDSPLWYLCQEIPSRSARNSQLLSGDQLFQLCLSVW